MRHLASRRLPRTAAVLLAAASLSACKSMWCGSGSPFGLRDCRPFGALSDLFSKEAVPAPPPPPGYTEDYTAVALNRDGAAQYNLGVIYANGQGVQRDDAAAVKWYRKAADQGLAEAQNNLGVIYAKGDGIPQDYVQAYMWLSLAAAGGEKDAIANRNIVAKLMTPAQIAEAQKLAKEWKPKKP